MRWCDSLVHTARKTVWAWELMVWLGFFMPRSCLTVRPYNNILLTGILPLPVLPSAQHKKPYLTRNFLQLAWVQVLPYLMPILKVIIPLKMLKEQWSHPNRRHYILKTNGVKARMKNFEDSIFSLFLSLFAHHPAPFCHFPFKRIQHLHCPQNRHSNSQPASQTQATLT